MTSWPFQGPRGARVRPTIPTVAVLKARREADAEGLVLALVHRIVATGGRPALLWCARTDALADGVVSVATSAELFPPELVEAARAATLARLAHMGAGAETRAARLLLADLGGATHAVIDGSLLGVVRAHLAVLVTGDEIGPELPIATALRRLCDVEVNAPGEVIATALILALGRRA